MNEENWKIWRHKTHKVWEFSFRKKEEFFFQYLWVFAKYESMRGEQPANPIYGFFKCQPFGRETHEWGVLWPVLLPSLKVKVIKCSLTVVSQSVSPLIFISISTYSYMYVNVWNMISSPSLANFIAFLWHFNDSKRFV